MRQYGPSFYYFKFSIKSQRYLQIFKELFATKFQCTALTGANVALTSEFRMTSILVSLIVYGIESYGGG